MKKLGASMMVWKKSGNFVNFPLSMSFFGWKRGKCIKVFIEREQLSKGICQFYTGNQTKVTEMRRQKPLVSAQYW